MTPALRERATLTLAAAARELEVSRETLRKWVNAGVCKVIRVGPLRRIPRAEVDRLRQSA